MYKVYTDGATSNNGKENAEGGWAFIIIDDNDNVIASGADYVPSPTTNNICELLAIINGCKTVIPLLETFDQVRLYSDSAYCINCVNQKWYIKWQQNGWINSSKKPVLNKELWEQLIPFFNDPRFEWIKIKGHSDNKYNNIVDEMAVNARLKKNENNNS